MSGVDYGDPRASSAFWDKVHPEPNTGCWLWGARVNAKGYGQIHIGGRSGMTRQVHRYLVECAGHDIRELQVLHTCDMPPCVNPDHLRIGTNDDNVRDRVAKRRSWSKLDESAVIDIRKRLSAGELQRTIASDYGINRSAVSMIGSKVVYKWVA